MQIMILITRLNLLMCRLEQYFFAFYLVLFFALQSYQIGHFTFKTRLIKFKSCFISLSNHLTAEKINTLHGYFTLSTCSV